MADIFDVVADQTRRDILAVLLDRTANGADAGDAPADASVSEIVAALGLSQPTVSKHLRVLREAGVVLVREEGQRRFYRIDAQPLSAVADWLDPYLASGPGHSDASGTAADAVPGSSEAAGLTDEAREFAGSVGRAFAQASHGVSSVVSRLPRPRRH